MSPLAGGLGPLGRVKSVPTGPVSALHIQATTIPSSNNDSYNQIAYVFDVVGGDVLITHAAMWDGGADGLGSESIDWQLWFWNGSNFVANGSTGSAVTFTGNAGDLDGNYRCLQLASDLTVTAGNRYAISANSSGLTGYFRSNDGSGYTVNDTFGGRIVVVESRYNLASMNNGGSDPVATNSKLKYCRATFKGRAI